MEDDDQPTLDAQDRDRLRAFREAANQVRQASVVDSAQKIHLVGEAVGDLGGFKITAQLFETEPFRSLALSVRLVYQQGEPAEFGRICGILHRNGDAAIQERARQLRRDYNDALDSPSPFLTFIGLFVYPALRVLSDPQYAPRRMFETWLYHDVFHQDAKRRASYEAFAALGDVFLCTVQGVVVQLAGRILDLDDLVADLLHEARVPRIGTPENGG